MKILINSMNFAPELIGIAKYSTEMAEWFLSKGHDVYVIASPPYYPAWRVQSGYRTWLYKKESVRGVNVYRCPIWVPAKPTGIKRLLHYILYFILSFPAALYNIKNKPDIIISVSPPILVSINMLILSRLTRAKASMHIQDFEIDAAFSLGMLKNQFLKKIALYIENKIMNKFDVVSTISEKMQEHLVSKAINKNKTELVPNWIDTEEIKPSNNKNEYHQRLNISDHEIVVLYSGNLGFKQGLDIIIYAAKNPGISPKIHFVISGDGAAKSELEQKANGLVNISWLPLQPAENLNQLLNLANIHILPQLENVKDLVMPSKLGGMLASGKPVIATASKNSQLYDVVVKCGVCVKPNDVSALVDTLNLLAEDCELRDELGKKAREFAVINLDKQRILEKMEQKIQSLVYDSGNKK